MSLVASTGRSEERACRRCGLAVRHDEDVTFVSSGPVVFWMPIAHAAPCGLPCIGGGVRVAVYRSGQVHGGGVDPRRCPRCGVLAPDPASGAGSSVVA